MLNIEIEETEFTPAIDFDPDLGIINIKGNSLPENTFDFYKQLMSNVEKYFHNSPQQLTTVNMEIIYFNSSSSKLFFDFLDLLDAQSEHKVIVNWLYDEENESMEEAGEEFKEDFDGLEFNLIKTN